MGNAFQDIAAQRREKRSGNWMAGTVKRPRALTAKAKSADMTTAAFARGHAHDSGRTGKQARLALTFAKYRNK